jgi:hypothetical protein
MPFGVMRLLTELWRDALLAATTLAGNVAVIFEVFGVEKRAKNAKVIPFAE